MKTCRAKLVRGHGPSVIYLHYIGPRSGIPAGWIIATIKVVL